MYKLSKIIAPLALVIGGQASYALAQESITLNFDYLFRSSPPTFLDPPRLTATFAGTAGALTLTIFNTWTGNQRVSDIYFNLDPSKDLGSVSFSPVSGDIATVNKAVDSFKADGDGYYDIRFTYPTSGRNANRFIGGESSVYAITGGEVVPASFRVWSSPVNGSGNGSGIYGPFYAAAQSNHSSGWVAAIPEPETYTMLLAGLGLMGWIVRRRRQSLEPGDA